MPEIDERAMAFVVETLKKNPSIELEELFQRTKKVSSSMAELSKRQFNARYPLQVKRRRALAVRAKDTGRKKPVQPKGRPSKKPRGHPSEPRDLVRQLFLQFATDITAAEERKDLVRVLAGVDQYVDQVFTATTGA